MPLDSSRMRTRTQILEVHKLVAEARRKIEEAVKDVIEPIEERAVEYQYVEESSMGSALDCLDTAASSLSDAENELMDAVAQINEEGE